MKTAKSQLAGFSKLLMQDIDQIKRAAVIRITNRVITASPVDKGIFRNGWNTSIGAVSYDTSKPDNKSGSDAIAEVKDITLGWDIGEDLFFNNPLPYGARLEFDGWSEQAPNGMLRVNVAKWDKVVTEETVRRRK